LQATHHAHRKAALWLLALVGAGLLALAVPALSRADESNPNNYNCIGSLAGGTPEEEATGTPVAYGFYCNGPITGYQLAAQVPLTGFAAAPVVSAVATGGVAGTALKDTFSCSGDIPGYAVNCVGSTKTGWEYVAGQFDIEKKLCVEPRVDVLLTVTYAYLEKNVVTQAISGPFDLGRPKGCPADAWSGNTRLEPKAAIVTHKKHKKGKKSAKKSTRHRARHASTHR
jgi:hypothetical protein